MLDDAKAYISLGAMYALGDGVPRNKATAAVFLSVGVSLNPDNLDEQIAHMMLSKIVPELTEEQSAVVGRLLDEKPEVLRAELRLLLEED